MGPWQSRRLQRSERIRFGVSLDQVCKHDIIPQPLLSVILKLNKDAPFRKNVFRAPGHEATVKKVIFLLQHGYVIDMEELSVYTLASVLKTFLRKLPGGLFGAENEEELFSVMELTSSEDRFKKINRVISSLPVAAQHLLVLLLGTFRVIADCASWADTGMTSEAVGVSVAPSIFRSCVSSGKMATMEDVIRFKIATQLTKYLVDHFGHQLLFSQSCYDYYTQMTGRQRPGVRDWKRGIYTSVSVIPGPPVIPARSGSVYACMKYPQPEAEQQSFQSSDASPVSPNGNRDATTSSPTVAGCCSLNLEQLESTNRGSESTHDLSYLPQVHERQTARLRSRLEWYSSPGSSPALSASHKLCEEASTKYGTVPNLDISSPLKSS